MHKAKKKQLRSWLRIGSTGCLAPGLTTSQPTLSLINLTIDIGRSWLRRRPAIHPHPAVAEGGEFRRIVKSISLANTEKLHCF